MSGRQAHEGTVICKGSGREIQLEIAAVGPNAWAEVYSTLCPECGSLVATNLNGVVATHEAVA